MNHRSYFCTFFPWCLVAHSQQTLQGVPWSSLDCSPVAGVLAGGPAEWNRAVTASDHLNQDLVPNTRLLVVDWRQLQNKILTFSQVVPHCYERIILLKKQKRTWKRTRVYLCWKRSAVFGRNRSGPETNTVGETWKSTIRTGTHSSRSASGTHHSRSAWKTSSAPKSLPTLIGGKC